MWRIPSTLTCTAVAWLATTTIEAQEGLKRPDSDDAIALYTLVIEELERSIPLPLIRPAMTPHGPKFEEQIARDKLITKAISNGVIVRSLFRQAVTRPKCTFPENALQGDHAFATKLLDVATCVMRHGDLVLKDDPAAASETACDMLRFAHHYREGLAQQANAKWLSECTFLRDLRALQLLGKALAGMEGTSALRTRSPRIRAELDRFRQRQPTMQTIVQQLHAEAPGVVSDHVTRAATSSPTTAARLDEAALLAQVKKLMTSVLGPAQTDKGLRQWLRGVTARRDRLLISDGLGEGAQARIAIELATKALQTRRALYRLRMLSDCEQTCRDRLAPKSSGR